MRKRRFGFIVCTLLAIALVMRAGPLYWSPLPSTLDGFGYAADAGQTMETGALPLASMRVDNFGFTLVLAVLGEILGIAPLYIAQPLATVVGTIVCLGGLAIARRVGVGLGWAPGKARAFAALVLATIAVEGLFLRRTLMPDEEILAHLLLLALVVSLYHALQTDRVRWYGLSAICVLAFPLTHTFTTFVAALVATALVVIITLERAKVKPLLGGGALVVVFWAYIAGYYGLAQSTPLLVPYVDRVTAYPGLFIAWIILLVIGVAWVRSTTPLLRRLALAVPTLSLFAIVGLNSVVAIFPGTTKTPQVVLLLVSLLVVPALLAVLGIGRFGRAVPAGGMVLAAFVGPFVIIGFSLTAALTPEYFATALRAQTYLHFPALLLACVALLGLRSTRGRSVAITALLAVLVLTAPLAYVNMDTGSAPSTTLSSEYAGVAFATETDGGWATDHSLSRVGILFFEADPSIGPVAAWLNGGPAPDCTVLSQRSWTTTGAHLFPSAPATVSEDRYRDWLRDRNVVYANSGLDPVTVSQSAWGDC